MPYLWDEVHPHQKVRPPYDAPPMDADDLPPLAPPLLHEAFPITDWRTALMLDRANNARR